MPRPQTQTQLLATVVERLDNVQRSLERDYKERKANEAHANEHRDEVNRQLSALTSYAAETRRRVEKIEPVADKLTKWQYVGTGVLMTVGAIGAFFGWLFHYTKDAVARLIGW